MLFDVKGIPPQEIKTDRQYPWAILQRTMILTTKQIKFYEENGYLIVEEFLSGDACDSIARIYDEFACGQYVNVNNLDREIAEVHDLVTDPGILESVDSLQDARMIPLATVYFFCKPGNPLESGSNLHQDNLYARAPDGSYLAVGISLDDADEGNGAVIVCPGTHRLGELPTDESKNYELDEHGDIISAYPIGNSVVLPEGWPSIQLSYAKGSLLFIHGHLVHGAPKNPSLTRWRRALYINYIKDGDPFWPGWVAKRKLIDRDKGLEGNLELWS